MNSRPDGCGVSMDGNDREAGLAALRRLNKAVQEVLYETGLDEIQLAQAITSSRPVDDATIADDG